MLICVYVRACVRACTVADFSANARRGLGSRPVGNAPGRNLNAGVLLLAAAGRRDSAGSGARSKRGRCLSLSLSLSLPLSLSLSRRELHAEGLELLLEAHVLHAAEPGKHPHRRPARRRRLPARPADQGGGGCVWGPPPANRHLLRKAQDRPDADARGDGDHVVAGRADAYPSVRVGEVGVRENGDAVYCAPSRMGTWKRPPKRTAVPGLREVRDGVIFPVGINLARRCISFTSIQKKQGSRIPVEDVKRF